MREIEMDGVREYSERMSVALVRDQGSGRAVVFARNEAGYNNTRVDLLDLLAWVRDHPDWEQMDLPTLVVVL